MDVNESCYFKETSCINVDVPDREVCLLPLQLGHGAPFLQHSQQDGPAPAGPVQAQTSGAQAAVHPSNQGQDGPHLGTESGQLGIRQRSAVHKQLCVVVVVGGVASLLLVKVGGAEAWRARWDEGGRKVKRKKKNNNKKSGKTFFFPSFLIPF